MLNEYLLKHLCAAMKEWVAGERDYSFETRMCFPLSDATCSLSDPFWMK